MSLPANKYRELVFQMLFSRHFSEELSPTMSTFFMKQLKTTRSNVESAFERASKIIEKKEQLDSLIAGASQSYDISRIQSVELNILRLSLYEILFDESIPEKVSISEALRLSKKFSTQESTSFVNAVLDYIYKNNSEKVYTSQC